MGDIGDEIAAGFLDSLGFGEIAKHGNRTSSGHWRGRDIEGRPGRIEAGAGGADGSARWRLRVPRSGNRDRAPSRR